MKAYVLLTAMPPTVGHEALVEFARGLDTDATVVIVMTQPGEPFTDERVSHFRDKYDPRQGFIHYNLHETIEQNPDTPGFRQMWANLMVRRFGFQKGDYIVTSEEYGAWLAEWLDGVWIPFDIDRRIVPAKATRIRNDYISNWNDIAVEFRTQHLTRRITTFGAESTGKTTLSRQLPGMLGDPKWAQVLPEWARPYLEAVGSKLSVEKMQHIYEGQRSLQCMMFDSPFTVQDTDLFSTLGYWRMYNPETIPARLALDAQRLKSDLYILCPSDIPFEADKLRYGGHQRESMDQYWIDILDEFELNYIILDRKQFGMDVRAATGKTLPSLTYDRKGF